MRLFLIITTLFIYLVNAKVYRHDVLNMLENDIKEQNVRRYRPDWKDLDKRPLPEWYDKAKVGIFVHWGVFSVPSFNSEWFWFDWRSRNNTKINTFMKKTYPPNFTYRDFAPMFQAELYEPRQWTKLFARSGAKYVVLTSKHHDGFTLFPSKHSYSWNAKDVGPNRDLLGDLANAVRAENLTFGVYYSLYEWYNLIYNEDKKTRFRSQNYVNTKVWPEIQQLIIDYKPSILWSDGYWEASDTYWRSTELLAWLYNESPVKDAVVVNDRWGIDIHGKHGDFYNYGDRFNPGKLLKHKWENAFMIDRRSWGYRRNLPLNDILSDKEILYQLVSTVSCGGNVLINIAPTKEGTIAPIFQERLLSLGKWLDVNGEAIYGSSPWLRQRDTENSDVWYTCRKAKYNTTDPIAVPTDTDEVTAVYGIVLKWPSSNVVQIADVVNVLRSGSYTVQLMGNDGQLKWEIVDKSAKITLPDKATVISEHAWTLKFALNS